jgi:hypothetical protein
MREKGGWKRDKEREGERGGKRGEGVFVNGD